MSQHILATKFFVPPLSPKMVNRTRLIELLNQGLHAGHKLTVLSAPPGFGKTMVLSEWISQHIQPVAWISLDETDNDPVSFWTSFISGLQTISTGLGENILSSLQSLQPFDARSILTALLNEISKDMSEFSVVLDDYHVISSRPVHESVNLLIEQMPPTMHLVIATRADPPLSLARLRGKGQLIEVRADDLRFTLDETALFLNREFNLNLLPEDISALESCTEGWIVGLQLSALSMQGMTDTSEFIRAFTGSHRYILEYLTEEVMQRQPEPVYRFLLWTSILNRFCASLCDSILGENNSTAILDYLQQNNLFLVPLDSDGHWYRYHHLFGDLLTNKLRKELPPEEIDSLHRQASSWYERTGFTVEAVSHALAIKDFERSAYLIEEAVKTSMLGGRITTLLNWLDELPVEISDKRPRLGMYRGYATFLRGDTTRAEQILRNSKASIRKLPLNHDNRVLLGELSSLLAPIASMNYDSSTAIEEAREALKLLPESDYVSRARATLALGLAYSFSDNTEKAIRYYVQAKEMAVAEGNYFLAASVSEAQALALIYQGRLQQAAECYRQMMDTESGESALRHPPSGVGYIGLAEIYLEWNKLNTAADYLDKGYSLCQSSGVGYNLAIARCLQARLLLAKGDSEAALEKLDEIEELVDREHPSYLAFHIGWYQVRLRLLLNDIHKAVYWAETIPEIIRQKMPGKKLPAAMHEVQQISMAKVYLKQGRYEDVLEIYSAVNDSATSAGRVIRIVEINLLKAMAEQARGNPGEALITLENALNLARPVEYIRLFLDEGDSAIELLKSFSDDETNPLILREYSKTIIRAYSDTVLVENTETIPKTRGSGMFEPLTERELEIMILIANGLSNQDIASRLFLAVGTIKKHINNIYGKLGVSKRTKAVARAQELGII